MNAGATLDRILMRSAPRRTSSSDQYLRPIYDEPSRRAQSVAPVRRLVGRQSTQLKRVGADLASEIASLAGARAPPLEGPRALEGGEHALACQLVELAYAATPSSPTDGARERRCTRRAPRPRPR